MCRSGVGEGESSSAVRPRTRMSSRAAERSARLRDAGKPDGSEPSARLRCTGDQTSGETLAGPAPREKTGRVIGVPAGQLGAPGSLPIDAKESARVSGAAASPERRTIRARDGGTGREVGGPEATPVAPRKYGTLLWSACLWRETAPLVRNVREHRGHLCLTPTGKGGMTTKANPTNARVVGRATTHV